MGGECRNFFCIARFEVFDAAESGPVECERPIEHHRVAGGAASRRPVVAKHEGNYILVDRERQASDEGGGSTIFGANCGRGAR